MWLALILALAAAVPAWAEDEPPEQQTAAPQHKPKLSGMTVPLPPKPPPKLCDVQPTELRTYPIRFVGAYDGDTIAATIDLGFGIAWNRKIRLLGVNTPEKWCSRHTPEAECEAQKEASKAAADFTIAFMNEGRDGGLFMKYQKDGKFGRALGVVCRNLDGKCINYELLLNKHAEYYCGGKR